jgi:hypothetical protein
MKIPIALALLVLAPVASGKGDGRSFVLAGQVANVESGTGGVVCRVTGDLLVTECRHGQCATTPWEEGRAVSLHVRQRESFFAMTPNEHGGAIQPAKMLAEVLKRAATPGRRTKLELVDPRISFGKLGEVVSVEAQVLRVTDYDLK